MFGIHNFLTHPHSGTYIILLNQDLSKLTSDKMIAQESLGLVQSPEKRGNEKSVIYVFGASDNLDVRSAFYVNDRLPRIPTPGSLCAGLLQG